MKKIVMALALGILGVSGALGVGCGKNSCDAYADDLVAKLEECGVEVTSTSGSGTTVECTDALAKQADCLDACLPKYDCACFKDPTGDGCTDKITAYSDCTVACQ